MSVVHATGREVPKNNAPESLQWSDILRWPLYIPIHPIQASPINHRLHIAIGIAIAIAVGHRFFSQNPAFKSASASATDSNSDAEII
jgi:hypothetical protein